ncbi:type II toxin-antitoxin system RelE/ParE family toxin [Pseudoroseomonas wenyumeiae]|uniref:Type II toxin-antitoxin system RelE/ParE family toxin n=1 Tax=Teichococcus wenyumeiae TaxID=2478470 RepID=A0A3A9J4T6_9PROT|nr:type II toxin-antitoxin system RelE/ParE family toxin [Pseudoroseomonas wenyumeiae]RKK02207.1 type II toxin-antitoxin system RelE/ParE family toxin [Pseudoroseomonas wenyumeiae]RMI16869.1 type II toxin-antitoxin system RelE/ParE family toxin [Pseudoroseomonas wenyumeiae]
MTTYNLDFVEDAKKEWDALDRGIREAFKKVLARRLQEPRVVSAKLRGGANLYKIKLRDVGYRLVYEVEDNTVTVLVLAVGRRKAVYARFPD